MKPLCREFPWNLLHFNFKTLDGIFGRFPFFKKKKNRNKIKTLQRAILPMFLSLSATF